MLVFNTRTRQRTKPNATAAATSTTVCKLSHRIVGHAAGALSLCALKGHLFSASSALLALHNTTSLYKYTKGDPSVVLGVPLMSSATPALASSGERHVLLADGPRLTLYESKFGMGKEKSDGADLLAGGAWIRNPLLLGIVLVMVFWQGSKMMKGRGGAEPDFGAMGGMGGMPGMGGMGEGMGGMPGGMGGID